MGATKPEGGSGRSDSHWLPSPTSRYPSFSKGNGRHARLITDVLIQQLGEQLFCWGGRSPLIEPTKLRSEYIEALRFADRGNLEPLWTFARQG